MRSGKSIIFWDTCITLAWLKDEKIWPLPVLKGMKDVADLVSANDAYLLLSTLMRVEIFMGRLTTEEKQKFSSLLRRSNVREVAPDMRVTDRASAIREYYNTRGNKVAAPDAIMLATAVLYKADEMHTLDGFDPAGVKHTGILALNLNVAGYPLVVVPPYPRGIVQPLETKTEEEVKPQKNLEFKEERDEEQDEPSGSETTVPKTPEIPGSSERPAESKTAGQEQQTQETEKQKETVAKTETPAETKAGVKQEQPSKIGTGDGI